MSSNKTVSIKQCEKLTLEVAVVVQERSGTGPCAYLNLADSVFVLSIIFQGNRSSGVCSAALILDALGAGYTTLMRRLFILCLSDAHLIRVVLKKRKNVIHFMKASPP